MEWLQYIAENHKPPPYVFPYWVLSCTYCGKPPHPTRFFVRGARFCGAECAQEFLQLPEIEKWVRKHYPQSTATA